jgi:hypothetical protein
MSALPAEVLLQAWAPGLCLLRTSERVCARVFSSTSYVAGCAAGMGSRAFQPEPEAAAKAAPEVSADQRTS